MDFWNEENKGLLKEFIDSCVGEELLYVKRRIHRLWDAQEEMVSNHLMILKRMEKIAEKAVNSRGGVITESLGKRPEKMDNALTLDESFAELEHIVPKAYAIWKTLFERGREVYLSDPVNNLLVEGNPMDKAFDAFGKLYLDKPGYLLDVGCGPEPVPYYLRDFPIEYIYGIDPLLPFEEHPFSFSQHIAEFIPYKDRQFDYVIFGTSLDHVLLLDKALNEIGRVLKDDGTLLIWAGTQLNVMDSIPYDPYREDIQAVDEFHMFHIAPHWLEKMMENNWMKDSHYADRYGNQLYAFKKSEGK